MEIHIRIFLKLAGRGEGRQLELDAMTGIVVFAISKPTLLLLLVLLVLGIDNVDRGGAFRAAVLIFYPESLALA